MKLKQLLVAALLGSQIARPVFAADNAAIEALKQQIQELAQKVRVLERQRENDQDTTATVAKAAPKLVIGSGGLSASSADSNFVFNLKGLVQVDNRSFLNEGIVRGSDSFLLRRARPIFQGTLYKDCLLYTSPSP